MPNPHDVFEHLDREPNAPRMSDLWEWARCDYFAGESADVVCERHKLSRSQFFERAKREGWLRRDQPRKSAEPAYDAEAEAAFIEDALDSPPPSAYTLYRRAWAMVERAILMGRRVEAAGWTRVARDLRKLALQEHNTSFWTMVARAEEPKPDSPDSVSANVRPNSVSPAQAGAQSTTSDEKIERSPHPDPDPAWAPAYAGETESGRPDYPDSVRPPPFTGEVAAQQTEGVATADEIGRPETFVTPSVTAPVAPRHLPRGAGEAESGPDSPDFKSQQALSSLAFKLSRRAKRRLRGRG